MNEVLAFLAALLGLGAPAPPAYTGYLEADYVYMAPETAGPLVRLAVAEGQHVAAGDLLFALDGRQQRAALTAAEARVRAAEAEWRNLATGGRAAEIEVARASLSKAEADLGLARSTFERTRMLRQRGTVSEARLDQDRAGLASAEAQVAQLRAQLDVAEMPARDAQQAAAEANLAAARAEAEAARLHLAERDVVAPVAGHVERLYYAAGEMVAAGAPVLSIRPDGALKARFYVAEPERAALAIGAPVTIACDGCAAGLAGRITHLSAEPETTPPIIYSRDERARLVFLAEAVLDEPGSLLPGQPVTVTRPQ